VTLCFAPIQVENMILLHSERLDRLEGDGGRDLPSNAGEEETNDRGGEGSGRGPQDLADAKLAPGAGEEASLFCLLLPMPGLFVSGVKECYRRSGQGNDLVEKL
jgi:hypothetical protein